MKDNNRGNMGDFDDLINKVKSEEPDDMDVFFNTLDNKRSRRNAQEDSQSPRRTASAPKEGRPRDARADTSRPRSTALNKGGRSAPPRSRGESTSMRDSARRPATQPQPPQKPPQDDQDGHTHRSSSGGGANRWVKAFAFAGVVVALCIFLAFFALESANDLFGLNKEDKKVTITLGENISTSDIVNLLAENDIIKKPFTFRLYADIKDMFDNYKPGEYVLNTNMSYDEIITLLKNGTMQNQITKVTFPEGLSVWEIANLLEENNVCGAQEFVDALNTGDFSSYSLIGQIPAEVPNRYHKMEGFLFPDTYEFYIDDDPLKVARRFFNNFESKINDELLDRMEVMGLSIYETINLASIIQGEAGKIEEMRKVSSVFHNRMDASGTYPRLESDVTRDYIKTDMRPYLDVENQEMYDAYNTYVCEGLPPGPVNNPGIDAIKATLYPDSTKNFFFVSDVNGVFYYATNFDTHQKNVYNARQIGDAQGVGVE